MKVCFVYAAPDGFSGQFQATKLLLDHLPANIERIHIPLPAWSGKMTALPGYGWKLIKSWGRTIRLSRQAPVFYINAGQSIFAVVRDGGTLLMARLGNRKSKKIISFNGNAFALWSPNSVIARLFTAMCNLAEVITVVGPNQKEKLGKLGVRGTILIVDNGSEMGAMDLATLSRKHENSPLKVLFLGNLLETKGYPVFLEALQQLSRDGDIPIEAVLAGNFIRDTYPIRFSSISEAERWVLAKIEEIQQSKCVRVKWIRGIAGAQKVEVLRASQVLVFPSAYPVEAQPFVLLESLASGVAIISSKTGEIGTTLTPETALFVDPAAVNAAAVEIRRLNNRDLRLKLARNGLELFEKRYTLSHYIDVWTRLICER
jgi:glycosyltransferase involved in cell wall biosynthesis